MGLHQQELTCFFVLTLICAAPRLAPAEPPIGEPRELSDMERYEIKLLFEDELWRPRGPRQDRVVALVNEGIRGGNLYVFLEMDGHVTQLWKRRLFDPRALDSALPDVNALSVRGTYFENRPSFPTAAVREGIALWNLPAKERHDLYELAIQREKDTEMHFGAERVGLTWRTASLDAMQEGMDDLLPLIEQVLRLRRGVDKNSRDLEEAIDQEYIPLARARQSRNWVRGYLEIIRQDASTDITASTRERLIAERRTREALLRLVVKNRRDALPALDEIWKTVRSKEITPYDDGYQRWAEIATPLLRATRALGSKAINEKMIHKLIPLKPEEALRSLRTSGLLRTADK